MIEVRPDGSDRRIVPLPIAAGECLLWSPDSSKIAFCGHNGDGNWAVWVMNADGSDARQLTHPIPAQPAGTGGDSPDAWSPDGQQLLVSTGGEGHRNLVVVNVDGSGSRQITDWDGTEDASAWLPNGQIVVAHFKGAARLPRWYLINSDGGAIRPLTQLSSARAGDPIGWFWPKRP